MTKLLDAGDESLGIINAGFLEHLALIFSKKERFDGDRFLLSSSSSDHIPSVLCSNKSVEHKNVSLIRK